MTNIKKLIAAIDADGVLLNFLMAWEAAAKKVLRRKIKIANYTYELQDRYGLTKAETDRIWAEFHNGNHWRYIPALDGASDAAKRLVEMGMEVHVVTAIPNHLLFDRILNLHKADIPFTKVHCVQNGKREKLEELSPIVFFDDHTLNLEAAKLANVPHRILIPNSPAEAFCEHATHIADTLHLAVEHLVNIDFLNEPTKIVQRSRSL